MYAIYIGTQHDFDDRSFDLFNVVDPQEKHVLHNSTVGYDKIMELGIKIILDKYGQPYYTNNRLQGRLV